jgi:predicted enzyme related to lactoylglutathione lyase
VKSTPSVWHHLVVVSRLWTVVVDAHDPPALARFWASVLDWSIFYESADEVVISKDDKTFPGLVFVPVEEAKTVKNRLHIDLNPPEDRDSEIERLIGLGAREVDIGQGEVGWTVLADPEGNEFCVLRARDGGV